MAVFEVQARRLLLAAGIGLAVVGGPAVAVMAIARRGRLDAAGGVHRR